jgi:putative protease
MADKKINKIEIVSPAGNLEKLKFAVLYGADAVYFGGDGFNLRIKSDNFSRDDIAEGVKFCREHGVRSIFLLNSFLHEKQINEAAEYINAVKDFGFDAVMVSDPGMMMLVKESGIRSDIHLSTQMSTLNHLSIKFWTEAGIKRIVLARETSLEEIRMIREHTDAEIEIFVHGALCVAYSGRCLLSRYMAGRDANNGDCSHPCRWNYSLVEKKRPENYMDIIEHESGTEILSSMDLCLINKLDEFIKAGVNAFKIEGRMKSVYYTANVTRIYKHALNCAGTDSFIENQGFWNSELDKISHRPFTEDLFNEFGNTGFKKIEYVNKSMFMGYKKNFGVSDSVEVLIGNPIRTGDELEAIFPIKEKVIDGKFTVLEIKNADGTNVDMARPDEIYTIRFNGAVADNAIFRKTLKK